MGRITIYLDDETERKMKRVIQSQQISQSGWVAENLLSQPPASMAVPTIVLYELQTGILTSHSTRTLLG